MKLNIVYIFPKIHLLINVIIHTYILEFFLYKFVLIKKSLRQIFILYTHDKLLTK